MSLAINGTDGIDFNLDAAKIKLGAGDDLQIFHDGDSSYINHVTSGTDLVIDAKSPGDDLILKAADDVNIRTQGNEAAITCIGDGAVELYYNGTKTFETNDNGAKVLGSEGSGGQLQIYADEGDDNQDKWMVEATTGGELHFKSYTSGSWEDCLHLIGNGGTELYYDNTKKIETTSDGSTISGSLITGSGVTSRENADSMLTIAETSGHCEVNIIAKNDSGAVLNFGDPDDYNVGRMKYNHSANEFIWDVNNTHRLTLESGGDLTLEDGNLKVASGHGIDFSAQTASSTTGASADAELLDHYEEGTWTPDPYTGTCSHAHSYYVRVGTLVTVWTELSSFSDTSTQSIVQIQGLPFASNSSIYTLVGHCVTSNSADGDGSNSLIFNTYSMLRPFGGGTGAFGELNYANLDSNSVMYITATYFAN